MLPPPWGTAADVVSLGKSLFSGDWGGALLDVVGLIPVAGDSIKAVGKGTKIASKMVEIADALKAVRTTLARQKKALINGRKSAAEAYWKEIREKGRKKYDEAIKNCSTKKCKEQADAKASLEKGPQYQYTPKGGKNGRWEGERGDGDWVPDEKSSLGQELQKFNKKGIPYENGFPNYDDFIYKENGISARVEIPQRGGTKDYTPADKAMRELLGDPDWTRPDNYTWHHKQDGVTMELVPTELHGGGKTGHLGGTSGLDKYPDF